MPSMPEAPWLWAAAVGLPAVAGLGYMFWRRHRRTQRRRRRRRQIIDRLESLQVDQVEVCRPLDGEPACKLTDGRLARHKGDLLRHRQGLLLACDEGHLSVDQLVLLRFTVQGVQHEFQAQVKGRARISRRARRHLNVDQTRLFLLMPGGVIVRRERRDMMRFFIGEQEDVPGHMIDARSMVRMSARIGVTDVDGASPLPRRLQASKTAWLSGGGNRPLAALADDANVPIAEVTDFSVSGLQVEATSTAMAALCQTLGVRPDDQGLELLADRVLLLRVAVQLDFPERSQDMEPEEGERPVWALAEVARVTVFEVDDSSEWWARLGLDLIYQPFAFDDVLDVPRRWAAITATGESAALQALHSALNRAAAVRDQGPG